MVVSAEELPPGTVIQGRYRVDKVLSQGGFGTVYLSEQLATGQRVALKVLLSQRAVGRRAERETARFVREMKLVGHLSHPNVVRLIDFGELEDGRLFTALEFIAGETLADLVDREGPLPVRETHRLMVQVLEALSAAHRKGVIHRDLKPPNIMVTDHGPRANAMVLDFGVSSITEEWRDADYRTLTAHEEVAGTPHYMAPEQLLYGQAGVRSDLYAWGLVFIEALCGCAAYEETSYVRLILRHTRGVPVTLPRPLADSPLGPILARATAFTPEARYGAADEVLHDLDGVDWRVVDVEALERALRDGRAGASAGEAVEARSEPSFGGGAPAAARAVDLSIDAGPALGAVPYATPRATGDTVLQPLRPGPRSTPTPPPLVAVPTAALTPPSLALTPPPLVAVPASAPTRPPLVAVSVPMPSPMPTPAPPFDVERARPRTGSGPGIARPDKPSLIVLPFANLSGDPEQEFFVDGLTEDILTALSRFQELFVISRNTSFKYKGRAADVQRVAREVGVQYVIEGSVRKAGSRIRISAQLTDVELDRHVWAERYDRELADVFAIQDEVTAAIVATLSGRVEAEARKRAARKTPDMMAAYELVLAGKVLHHRSTPTDNVQALSLLERAIALDPSYAHAHAWKACTLGQAWTYGWYEDRAKTEQAIMDELDVAMRLDENDSDVHRILAAANLAWHNFDQACHHQQRAFGLNPNDPLIVVQQGEILTWLGRPEEGIEWIRKAMRLDPFHPPRFWSHLGRAYFVARRYAEAIDAYHAISPLDAGLHACLAACYARLGDAGAAHQHAAEALALDPGFRIRSHLLSAHHRQPSDLEHHRSALREAGLPE